MKNLIPDFLKPTVQKFQSKLTRGSFNHNVLIVLAGTVFGQMGTVILSPILTRLYSPSDFGTLGAFSSLLAILIVLGSLRYEMALPIAKTQDEIVNLLAVCLSVLCFTTAIISLGIFLLPYLHTGAEEIFATIWPYRMLLPLGFVAMGAYQVMVNLATRQAEYSQISKTKVYQGLSGPLLQICLGISGAGVWGLLVGFIVGQSTGVSLLYSKIVRAPRLFAHKLSRVGMMQVAKRYKSFPLISSWSGLISAAGSNALLIAVLPFMFSSTIAGFVVLTDRVIGRPLLMITTSILQVYIGDVGKSLMSDRSMIRKRFLSLALQQTVIVSGWLLVVNICAPFLFSIVFGEQWGYAVPYLQVLSIAYLFQMVMHAFAHTLQLLEKQLLSLCWEVGRLVLVVGAFVAGSLFGLSALQTLLVYSICQAFAHLVLFILMYHSISSLNSIPDPVAISKDDIDGSPD